MELGALRHRSSGHILAEWRMEKGVDSFMIVETRESVYGGMHQEVGPSHQIYVISVSLVGLFEPLRIVCA